MKSKFKWRFVRFMPEGHFLASYEAYPTEEAARAAAFGFNGYGVFFYTQKDPE